MVGIERDVSASLPALAFYLDAVAIEQLAAACHGHLPMHFCLTFLFHDPPGRNRWIFLPDVDCESNSLRLLRHASTRSY
jgi:hypothetical protein